MRHNIKEIVVAFGFVVIALLLLNPLEFWMPDMMVVGMLIAALVFFGLFAAFILRERAVDERDVAHMSLAGRNAFLGGSAVLLAGLMAQGYRHEVDPWLVVALTTMVLAKLVTRIWSDQYR